VSRGTDGSNPVPSTGESLANSTFGAGSHSMTEARGVAIPKRWRRYRFEEGRKRSTLRPFVE